MLYLESFSFPDADREFDVRLSVKRTSYNTMYPFTVLSGKGLLTAEFEPITIFYGGNGSGKTTALNVIGEKLGLKRDTPFNRSSFFEDYVRLCRYESLGRIPDGSRVITSDDVFDFMLNLRSLNAGIDTAREDMFEEYQALKKQDFRLRSMEDYQQLKRVNEARRKTESRFVKSNLQENVREQSNGESAFYYFTNTIQDDALYLLDEPENSLSPERQEELSTFLENQARFFNCQFIIATHSPFLLALRGARVYDLDADPAAVKRWTELKNVRAYYEFFRRHTNEFTQIID